MWKFDASKGMEPIPGIPLEADDRTFSAAVEAYEAQFRPGDKGSVKKTLLYIHTDEKAAAAEKEA